MSPKNDGCDHIEHALTCDHIKKPVNTKFYMLSVGELVLSGRELSMNEICLFSHVKSLVSASKLAF